MKETYIEELLKGKLKRTFDLEKLSDMIGSTIVDIGKQEITKEGGFSIDYRKPNGELKRLVLGYTELGEWIECLESIK